MFIIINKKQLSTAFIGLFLICLPILFKSGLHTSTPQEKKESPYGQYLNWQEVNQVMPKYAIFTVADLDSGLQFCVQRRGGYYHADVQPLTAADTAVMKKIYAGKWTWKRRAITVKMDDGIRIAASMNGMPHGQGAIEGNQFDGHFCIHFAGSKTHGSKKIDPAHQIMIWKSANILDKKFKTLSEEKSIEVFFIALNQGDEAICTKIIASRDKDCWRVLREIESIRINTMVRDDGMHTYRMNLQVKYKEAKEEINQTIDINLSKKDMGWKINPDALLSLHKIDIKK
ncbi:MAG: hypothetical protein ACM3NJ_00630 [Methanobacterium sp.]